ncbi:transmembrane protein 255B isoform X3 [Saimiri boliviensis]|uniref:transmembrane protein 255B isoform X3 n=1 Tax=Saimiri boliviensis TaxID=27679 RepID=UPI003D76C9BC
MQPPAPGPLALLDAAGLARRKKTSLWFVGSLLLVSILIVTVGLAATTRTENVTVGGYYPGIILGFGSFLGVIGINLVENRRQMLVAAIVFVSFGVAAAFCCAIVDGVFAARHIEPRPLSTGRCQFYSSGVGYLYDIYQTEVTCHSLNGKCQLKVRSNTCYCCDLYTCGSAEPSPAYYEFVGVRSCQDVLHLHRLLWASAVLNVLGLFLGIITAAVLGAFKDMTKLAKLSDPGILRSSPLAPAPVVPTSLTLGPRFLHTNTRQAPSQGSLLCSDGGQRLLGSSSLGCLCHRWPMAPVSLRRPSTTLPSRFWPSQASARRRSPPRPAHPTLSPFSPAAASQLRPPPPWPHLRTCRLPL